MPFDQSLDKEIWSKEVAFENTKLSVKVMSYNEGPSKLQLSRENVRGEDFSFAKLGRLTKQEVEAILPLIQEAIKEL